MNFITKILDSETMVSLQQLASLYDQQLNQELDEQVQKSKGRCVRFLKKVQGWKQTQISTEQDR